MQIDLDKIYQRIDALKHNFIKFQSLFMYVGKTSNEILVCNQNYLEGLTFFIDKPYF